MNVPPNLHLYGSASRREVQDALAACSVLVVTSKREGLPTLVLEAMVDRKTSSRPRQKQAAQRLWGRVNSGSFTGKTIWTTSLKRL